MLTCEMNSANCQRNLLHAFHFIVILCKFPQSEYRGISTEIRKLHCYGFYRGWNAKRIDLIYRWSTVWILKLTGRVNSQQAAWWNGGVSALVREVVVNNGSLNEQPWFTYTLCCNQYKRTWRDGLLENEEKHRVWSDDDGDRGAGRSGMVEELRRKIRVRI